MENLLVRAVRHRSFEKVTASAQRLASQQNLGDLVALFEELGDDGAFDPPVVADLAGVGDGRAAE